MSDKIEYSRMLVKRTDQTGVVPTIPPVTATTLNQMIPTDLFVGEFFLNEIDDLLWIRTETGILPIALSGSTGTTSNQTLTQVLFEGNVTNGYDIVVSAGDTIQYQGLNTGSTSNLLGIDASGNTIVVTGGTSGGSGTSGTSGSSGTSGNSGTSGSSGTSGTSGVNGTSGTSGVNGTSGSSGTSGTSGGGDTLWTSGSTVGSRTSTTTNNTNTQEYSLVAGFNNTLAQTHSAGITGSSIVVGYNNNVDGPASQVFGLQNFLTSSYRAFIQGATNSGSSADNSAILGSQGSSLTNTNSSFIGGGVSNQIRGNQSAIIGGNSHYISGGTSTIIGGYDNNLIANGFSSIIGGTGNTLNGNYSVILGGYDISATTDNMVYVPKLTIVSATTGGSQTVLTIDSDTGEVYTATNFLNPYTGNVQIVGQSYVKLPTTGNTTSATTINWNDGNVQEKVLNVAATTFTFTNPNAGGTYILILRQRSTGGGTVTFPGTVTWAGGTTPTMTTTANKYDVYTFVYDGSKYFGSYVQDFT